MVVVEEVAAEAGDVDAVSVVAEEEEAAECEVAGVLAEKVQHQISVRFLTSAGTDVSCRS